MKIRSTDPPGNLPPEPEEIREKTTGDVTADQGPLADSKPARAKDPSGISSEVLTSLGKIADRGELRQKFVDLALEGFRDSLPTDVLEKVKEMLAGQIGDDPYIQEKLERISSLLEKTR